MELILEQIIERIDRITDKFYKQEPQEGLKLLNQSLNLISNGIEQLIKECPSGEVSMEYQEIIKYLKEALIAMEERDTILLADILQYELKERFLAVLIAKKNQ